MDDDQRPHSDIDRKPSERDRLERVYRRYSTDPQYKNRWTSDIARFMRERKREEISRALLSHGLASAGARLLDLGAGDGGDCDHFRSLGIRAEGIVALEMLHEWARSARLSHSWLSSVLGDGAHLPFRDGSFDLVYQSTMLSSVLDLSRRSQILGEVRRVLAGGGAFVSYDTRYPNPWNRDTLPVPAEALRAAFPGWRVFIRSMTPIPHLVRLLGFLPPAAWRAIERVPAFRSHLLIVARKP